MNVEEIIQYLLIGNLYSKKIIYEMSNTNNGKIIFDINQIFLLYSKKWHIKPGNSKVDSYNVFITVERIIMISKSKESFSVNQNFELFNKIINDVPELSKMSRWNYIHEKENLKNKITSVIHEFFNNMKTSHKILNKVSFKKNEEIADKKNNTKYYDEQTYLKQIRNSLISNNLDLDKFSFNHLIQDDNTSNGNDNETLKVSKQKRKKKVVKIIDENEQDKSNMSKSLVRASLIVKNMNNNTNNAQNPKLAINLLQELDSMIRNISYCKKIIIVLLVIIIIIEIIVIPLIIKFSYSY
jgi:hypothetical protein